MLTSYHVHSRISDGETDIRELVQGAIDQGLDEIGISDHYVLLEGGNTIWWSMKLDYIGQYVEQVLEAREDAKGKLSVKLGLEADYDPHSASELKDILQSYPFDYVIGSVHILDGFSIDDAAEFWAPLSQDERDDIIRRYWIRLAEMAGSRLFDLAGHLDLYKKWGIRPSVDISGEINTALDAIAEAGMPVELNTAGWYKIAEECYPSLDILDMCFRRNIPVLITADAHNPACLTRDYDRARELLVSIGYRDQAVFSQRKMSLISL